MKRPKGVRIIVSGRRYYLNLLVCQDRNQMFPFVAPHEVTEFLMDDYAQLYDERKKGYILTKDALDIFTKHYLPRRLREMNREGTFYYKADIVSSDFDNSFVIFEDKG